MSDQKLLSNQYEDIKRAAEHGELIGPYPARNVLETLPMGKYSRSGKEMSRNNACEGKRKKERKKERKEKKKGKKKRKRGKPPNIKVER